MCSEKKNKGVEDQLFDKEISVGVNHRINEPPPNQENCQFELKGLETGQNEGRLSDFLIFRVWYHRSICKHAVFFKTRKKMASKVTKRSSGPPPARFQQDRRQPLTETRKAGYLESHDLHCGQHPAKP